jgi:hypothetical protein
MEPVGTGFNDLTSSPQSRVPREMSGLQMRPVCINTAIDDPQHEHNMSGIAVVDTAYRTSNLSFNAQQFRFAT